jgi:hypothetical protein
MISAPLPDRELSTIERSKDFFRYDLPKLGRLKPEKDEVLQSACTISNRFWLKKGVTENKRLSPCLTGPRNRVPRLFWFLAPKYSRFRAQRIVLHRV